MAAADIWLEAGEDPQSAVPSSYSTWVDGMEWFRLGSGKGLATMALASTAFLNTAL